MRNGKLRHPNRMNQVDVIKLITIRVRCIKRLCCPWRVPEITPVRLVHPRPWADDIYVTEFFDREGEHRFQVAPFCYVRAEEEGAGVGCTVLVDEGLRFGAEGEVGYEDGTVASEQEAREFKRDTYSAKVRVLLQGEVLS